MFQFAKKPDNLLSSFLNLLQVQYTPHYASKLYYEHPYYNSLFGISQMLFAYNIDNSAIELNKKEDILLLDMPFIACFQNDFVLVYKITRDKVYYKTTDYNINITLDLFYEQFTGVVLVAEKTDNTIEPDYKINQKKERYNLILRVALSVSVIALISGIYVYNHLYVNLWEQLALLINFAGIYVGFLLTKKSLHIQSKQADRICSLFKQSSCNNILESKDAKFLGLIGWSEIGLGYFVSNTLISFVCPVFIFRFKHFGHHFYQFIIQSYFPSTTAG
ncbi:MAG: cysteine peptidase family C39 domain-containing protein [Paludibacteraceae bacterium]